MKIGKAWKGAALAVAATFGIAATANWNAEVRQVDNGHVIGNPDAKHTLTEFVSYTCNHCASFTKQGEGTLQFAFIGPGHMQREVRNIVRDPLDLTAAMLTSCGDPRKFPQNHVAFMRSQDEWLPIAGRATAAQRQRWNFGPHTARRRAIAADFGFYKMMERRGYQRTQVDQCLADDAKALALAKSSAADLAKYELSGTPSFAVDGEVLRGTHDWATLEPQLTALYRP